jgi:uncharacterized membrane protein (DUF2068 family)
MARSVSYPKANEPIVSCDLHSIVAHDLKESSVKRNAKKKQSHDKGLLTLAIFKWFKGLVLFLVGVGFLKLMRHGVAATVHPWVNALRVDPDNRYLGTFLAKLNLLDEKKIKALSELTIAYSTLFLVEGTGLFFEKRWAAFLTIIATISFIPIEIYELLKAPSLLKGVALVINAAIAVFLVLKVRRARS